ncbi:hypothetical protein [Cupriavidus nantongensis]|uniref:Uncharacterized protein n=1 Tax=Cupriavidus nantongensis TaxID=1796606 RepID=A0A142JGR1_9BURK|nr:hypothetical protein [Cupriavidus nantongensis]AMR77273.1 hypothetical protein A2G96_05745 [Cupriavidus nantongensis]
MNPHATRNVVSLVEYRAQRAPEPLTTISINLNPDGTVGYSHSNLRDEDAFRALVGCYCLMGQFMKQLRDKLEIEA